MHDVCGIGVAMSLEDGQVAQESLHISNFRKGPIGNSNMIHKVLPDNDLLLHPKHNPTACNRTYKLGKCDISLRRLY